MTLEIERRAEVGAEIVVKKGIGVLAGTVEGIEVTAGIVVKKEIGVAAGTVEGTVTEIGKKMTGKKVVQKDGLISRLFTCL